MEESDTTTAELLIQRAAHDLGRARRHATLLERLAISILTFGLVSAVLIAITETYAIWQGITAALAAAAVWGALRTLALLLHLRVDETMVELDDR